MNFIPICVYIVNAITLFDNYLLQMKINFVVVIL